MGLYKYIRETWNAPSDSLNDITKARLVGWRKEPATIRIKFPTRLDRARSIGYRAKQGVFIVRQRVNRGGHRKPMPGSRRSRKYTTRKSLMMNYQTIAEQRASKAYPNCEVLNSYEVAKDGRHYWFEVILVDVSHPVVLADKEFSKIVNQRGRAFRGLTVSARKSRGLLRKGKGTEKMRPSKYANRKRRFY